MGKKTKIKQNSGYNKKARGGEVNIAIDDSETKKIRLSLQDVDESKYDESNPLVLPSKKRKTVIKVKTGTPKQSILSKKQRKILKKVVERREKKSNRADLVSELQNYQLSSETFRGLTPLIQVQTEGLKVLSSASEISAADEKSTKRSGKSGWKKSGVIVANKQKFLSWSRRFTKRQGEEQPDNPKILGFTTSTQDESSSTSSDDEDNDDGNSGDKEANELSLNDGLTSSDAVTPSQTSAQNCTKEEEMAIASATFEQFVDSTKLAKPNCPVVENESSNTTPVLVGKHKVPVDAVSKSEAHIPKKFVHVTRSEDIMAVRSKLPIIPEEQVIMEEITENLVVVLAGETGCGKTTQVPQFLYEAGYAANGKIIGITEPRRVAAISMASRVAKELSLSSQEVSFQIRFEGTVSSRTLIKFMTDGVLLKEMGHDFLLTKYSVICIDEAHERSLFTDILIGLLSRCVNARKKRGDPLKLVVMSATMRIEDFMENNNLFKTKPGFIHIPARQFPVQIHFSKVTPENYLEASIKKIIQIHKKFPPGGILVFVTGQQEVLTVIKHLQKLCPPLGNDEDDQTGEEKTITSNKRKRQGRRSLLNANSSLQKRLKSTDLSQVKSFPHEEETESDSDDSDATDGISVNDIDSSDLEPLHILPLFSMLPIQEQRKVFEAPPPGRRLCVITTNVAETSLTIPSIRYVVDTGKVKDKLWDKVTGVQTFKIAWCSKASAEQRAGRAGRIGPGHCYRLFSSAVFEHEFEEYSTPEIKVRPVDDMVLLMKSMAIDNVKNFPYPTHPGEEQLTVAENMLVHLGALEKPLIGKRMKQIKSSKISTITPLGSTMSQFPVGPRFAKMLAMSFNHSLTEHMVLLASALTVQEVLLGATTQELQNKWTIIRKKWVGSGSSFLLGDCMVLLKAVRAFELEGCSPEYCYKVGLRYKAMIEIRKLRKQLTNNINLIVSNQREITANPHLPLPTDEQCNILRQIILSGCPDRIARRVEPEEIGNGEDKTKFKHAYKCGELEDVVYIHQSSALRKSQPHWIIYQEAFEINNKIFLRGITVIEPEWILSLCPTMCRHNTPLKEPPPYYDAENGLVKCYVKATYGKQGWELPITEIEYPVCKEKYSHFAQYLLEGDIFERLREWRNDLLSLPKTMTKSWAKLQPRTESLLQTLMSTQVDTKEKLKSQWELNTNFLLVEYLEWIPERLHAKFSHIWPPLDK